MAHLPEPTPPTPPTKVELLEALEAINQEVGELPLDQDNDLWAVYSRINEMHGLVSSLPE